MLFSLLLTLSTSQARSITFELPEQSPYSLNSDYVPSDIVFLESSDAEASAKTAKEERNRRFSLDAKYDKRFKVSHRFSKVGIVTMGAGGVTAAVGVGVVFAGFFHSILIWDLSPLIPAGTVMVAGGAALVGLGFMSTSIGSVAAGIALRKMGEDVPLTGLYIAASGAAVLISSSLVNSQSQGLQDPLSAAYSLGSLAIPVGFIWQVVQNNRSYNSYMEKSQKVDFHVFPQINHMGVGAVAQLTF